MTARPTLVRAPDASNDSRLTEAEVDAAIADPRAGWQCAQGRGCDWPMPEEVPSLRNPWTWLLFAIVVVLTIGASIYADWVGSL